MKSFIIVSTFLAAAMAQCDGYSPQGTILCNAISSISDATATLDTDVKAYDGGSGDAIKADVTAILDAISSGNDAVAAADTLESSDALIITPVQTLGTQVQTTVSDTIAQKDALDAGGQGYTALVDLQQILAATNTFIDTVNGKLGDLAAAAPPLESPILEALSSGVAASTGETSGAAAATSSSAPPTTSAPAATTSASVAASSSASVAASSSSATAAKTTGSTSAPAPLTATSASAFTGAAKPTAAAAFGAVLAAVGALAVM